jgi:hypothetical protein
VRQHKAISATLCALHALRTEGAAMRPRHLEGVGMVPGWHLSRTTAHTQGERWSLLKPDGEHLHLVREELPAVLLREWVPSAEAMLRGET